MHCHRKSYKPKVYTRSKTNWWISCRIINVMFGMQSPTWEIPEGLIPTNQGSFWRKGCSLQHGSLSCLPPGICTWPSQKPAAGLGEPLVWSTLAVPVVLNLPATKVHIYQFDNVSCSLDKNTNKPHGARHCVCKVNQCAAATKSKTCCWLTTVCPKIKK